MPCIVRSITADAVLVKRSTVGAPHQTAEPPVDRKWAKKISTKKAGSRVADRAPGGVQGNTCFR